ncbi:TetR/AcrR family transcriptional regulator [Streptomyces sp. NPDC005498]|uniref:TetR/AcrR family transcriptional regulator n=1 Tax=Streptomyces sp. NPDC005498 TaxID=3364717 RepID=UPI00368B4B6A
MTITNSRPTRRPRNRKELILAAAMDCFQRSGYQATGMEDIASAVGITAGALYRHFRSKQELLGAALLDSTDRLMAVMTAAEQGGLAPLMQAIASFSLDHRSYAVVWDRETRLLSAEHQAEVQQRHGRIAAMLGEALRAERPDLDSDDVLLLSWALLAVLASPSYHHTELGRPRFDDLLYGLAKSVAGARLSVTGRTGAPPAAAEPGLAPVSRREALLAAATPLFAERGFQSVSMEDVGAALGISRLAVYHHFPGKADLLAAALHRASEAKWATLVSDLAQSSTPPEGLRRALRSYAESALVDHGTGMLLLVSEIAHLSAADQEVLHRSQVDYVAEWVALLLGSRPELGQAEARITVHAVFTVLNLLPRLPLFAHLGDPAAALTKVGLSVLQLGSAS